MGAGLMLVLSCTTKQPPCPPLDQVWIESSTIANLADVGVTPEQMIFVIGWGFGVVLFGWILGYGLGLALGLIKKA